MPDEKKGALRKLFSGLVDILHDEPDPLEEELEKTREQIKAGDPGAKLAVTKQIPIAKVDVAKRLVYGVVYEPGVADAHGDTMTAAEIEKACHGFMERYATLEGDTGVDHVQSVGRHQLPIVENFIAPVDFKLGKQLVKAGTWVMVAKAKDDQLWKAVQDGQYTGWSFEGFGRRVAA